MPQTPTLEQTLNSIVVLADQIVHQIRTWIEERGDEDSVFDALPKIDGELADILDYMNERQGRSDPMA